MVYLTFVTLIVLLSENADQFINGVRYYVEV